MTLTFKSGALKLALISMVVSLSSSLAINQCYAESSVQRPKESVKEQSANQENPSGENIDCPDIYLKYKQMEEAYQRPQLWQGCDGEYEVTQNDNTTELSDDSSGSSVFIYSGFGAFKESRSDGSHSEGITYYGFTADRSNWASLSAQVINSPDITYNGEPDTLYSVYVSMGVQFNYPISPYVEFGVDLGDLIAEQILKENLISQEDITDYYFSIGAQMRSDRGEVFARGYYKLYVISQDNDVTFLPVLGIGVGISF